jgi:dihydrofolate synthase / folylpolyglutamate synthase
MTSAYDEAVAQLSARGRFGIRLGLGRTRALLRAFDNPERTLRGVLIGGTNGKGSVQALVAAALQQAGYRVGQTPKPHLSEYRERIVVDGVPIAADDFAEVVGEVLAQAQRIERRVGPPTEFEALTCAAFVWFARAGVDVAVVEVGLGGRLDATNAWQGGVSAITNVALDHTEILGPTTVAIAREKAQIVKRGDHAALTGATGDALAVLRRRAARVGVPLSQVKPLPVLAARRTGIDMATARGPLHVGLLGRHQAANAALALEILDALASAGIAATSWAAISSAFAGARWPGRMELLSLGEGWPDVLLDGAHNPHGAAALAAALDELRPELSAGRPTLLIGVVREKDLHGLLEPLRSSAALADAAVIATRVPDTPRSNDPSVVAQAWGANARAIDETDEALAAAMDAAGQAGGPLIIAGSLYLVGHVRDRLIKKG